MSCHGGVKQMSDFSLLFEEDAYGKTESGKPALVPRKPGESELYKRIIHSDPDERMPQEADALTKEEITLIKQWIKEGAKWDEHWAYSAPESIEIPKISSDWVKRDLDYFILEKIEQAGLQTSKEADRATLLRRASLDLTGLPPSPEELEFFLKDDAPDAYEKQIDRLLASPHFGERWAAMWLDLARYADSDGYESDRNRNIWRYRDWVIEAFNSDMPFDQFTIEQIAGDLLQKPSQNQLIATAFHRNTMTNKEGGTDDVEYRIASVIDRVNTTFEIWQSTTIACVQCHSHPYDPIRHEEFYEVFDIFNHTLDADLSEEAPTIELFQENDAENINATIAFIQNLEPSKKIDTTALLSDQIRQAVFPQLIPSQCDDFQHVQFFGDQVTNTSWNLNAGLERQFYFSFEDIDLTNVEAISYTYKATGNEAKMELRLDSLNGRIISSTDFTSSVGSKNDVKKIKSIIQATTGKHRLVFEIINSIKKAPEGIVYIKGMEFHLKNRSPNPAVEKHKKELIALRRKADKTPIIQAKSDLFRRRTHVFDRGNYLLKGNRVEAGVPKVLPHLPKGETPRLAFAKWLVSKENPLTSRVIVNRLWEQIFGIGIIETLEDFGTQGLKASHPELLDFMALRFQNEHQWSIKKLLKEILLSATYRQSSKTTPEKLEKDPYNRLLARAPRFRLSAEQIRDQALFVSGLLNDSIGGKSVMPPQPKGLWQQVYSGEKWKTAKDHARFRRGLYIFWKRTTPYPSMIAFDSPSREFCVSRRIRTNTPLQALVTLNDPAYLEMAEALAARMVEAGGKDLSACMRAGYKMALGKEADQATVQILLDLYEQSKKELEHPVKTIQYENTEETGDFLIKNPMTVVANALMNLDGFVMKE